MLTTSLTATLTCQVEDATTATVSATAVHGRGKRWEYRRGWNSDRSRGNGHSEAIATMRTPPKSRPNRVTLLPICDGTAHTARTPAT